jgi:hypothetical protein
VSSASVQAIDSSLTRRSEMITTVLESESYLFTPRELWVLRHIIGLPCESYIDPAKAMQSDI